MCSTKKEIAVDMDNKCGENVGRGFNHANSDGREVLLKRLRCRPLRPHERRSRFKLGRFGVRIHGRPVGFFSEVFLHTQGANAATPTEVFS
jgi:hypothetical protein